MNALLRKVFTKTGPHRSATPEAIGTTMFSIAHTSEQPNLAFIREGGVKFTPAQANTILKNCRYKRQRDETRAKAHIQNLAEMMRRGLWLPKSQLDFARLKGVLILVNGHHRMNAQIDSGLDILWNIAIHDVRTDEELRSLYYRFDTNLRKRSKSNIVDGVGFGEDADITKRTRAALFNAASIIAMGMKVPVNGSTLLTDDILAVADQYIPEAEKYQKAIKKAPGKIKTKLHKAQVFAVAMVTYKAAPILADEFWRGVAEDDGLARGDPRKALLLDMMSRDGSSGLKVANMMAAARAWNAFAGDRKLTHLKVTGSPVPISKTGLVVTS